MKWGQDSKKIIASVTFGFMVMTGTYNAIVINSQSSLNGQDVRFAKRLDEVYGVLTSKREVANSLNWQKVSVKESALYRQFKNDLSDRKYQEVAASEGGEQTAVVASEAAVQEDLNLTLSQVMNPKKWQQGLNQSQFSGSLSTKNGVIESLSISLPNDEGVSVSFSEMSGNVFEYDFNGELYSGMMYQDGENSYVVTLTNGPLEGTRLTFTGDSSVEQQQQAEDSQRNLAESSEAEIGQEVAAKTEAPLQDQEMPSNDVAQPETLQDQDILAQEQGVLEQGGDQAQLGSLQDQQT
jgi:hypothetical protein